MSTRQFLYRRSRDERLPHGARGLRGPRGEADRVTLSQPGDAHELEAERVADDVVRMPADPALKPLANINAQQGSAPSRTPAATGLRVVDEVLSSPGEALDPETRASMEPRFRHDFSQVRVHRGDRATDAARAVGAAAFTVGEHIVLRADLGDPGREEGRRLMAHELTHVVQHAAGGGAEGAHGAGAHIARRALGHHRERIGPFSDIDVDVRTRSVEEWREFLENEASSQDGGDELIVFMARALGKSTLASVWLGGPEQVPRMPTEEEALDLMEALLTTGGEIDFDEDTALVFPISDFPHLGNDLLGEFNRTFAPKALLRMTGGEAEGARRLGNAHTQAVKAYIKEADGGYSACGEAGPGLIDSALGVAVGAAVEYIRIGSDTYLMREESGVRVLSDAELTERLNRKSDLDILVHNAASTIAGAVLAHKALSAQAQALQDAIIAGAMSILIAPVTFRISESARVALGGGTTGLPSAPAHAADAIRVTQATQAAVAAAAKDITAKLVTAAATRSPEAFAQMAIEGFTEAVDDIRRELRRENPTAVDSNAGQSLISTFAIPLSQRI